ncbi:2-hydroxyisoflavanone dehydratase [Bertholletia excelsa]
MASTTKEVATELLPLLRVYTDGTVERLVGSPFVAAGVDPATGVSSKDVCISPDVSARLYLPKLSDDYHEKLPVLVYFHGGGFCVESAFSFLHHRYINILTSQAKALTVSVEFRSAPEHPLPAAYHDARTAYNWVVSHSAPNNTEKDLWLTRHGDLHRLFLGGDASGANIAHNTAMSVGVDDRCFQLRGLFLCLPFFWGSEPIGSEPKDGHLGHMISRVWNFAYPAAGLDHPMVNPFAAGAPTMARMGGSRLLVCVGQQDICRERGIHYCDAVRESGWRGEVELYEAEGGKHGFHIVDPETEMAKAMIARLASFFQQ